MQPNFNLEERKQREKMREKTREELTTYATNSSISHEERCRKLMANPKALTELLIIRVRNMREWLAKELKKPAHERDIEKMLNYNTNINRLREQILAAKSSGIVSDSGVSSSSESEIETKFGENSEKFGENSDIFNKIGEKNDRFSEKFNKSEKFGEKTSEKFNKNDVKFGESDGKISVKFGENIGDLDKKLDFYGVSTMPDVVQERVTLDGIDYIKASCDTRMGDRYAALILIDGKNDAEIMRLLTQEMRKKLRGYIQISKKNIGREHIGKLFCYIKHSATPGYELITPSKLHEIKTVGRQKSYVFQTGQTFKFTTHFKSVKAIFYQINDVEMIERIGGIVKQQISVYEKENTSAAYEKRIQDRLEMLETRVRQIME